MDVFMPIALCVIFIILFTICGWCCKRKREGTVYGYGPSVTVTTTTQHVPSPQIVPPYPIDARHPLPGNNAPGFATRQPPYPTQVPNMPFPQSGISNPPMAPYPPAHYQDYNSNPPPYEVAISQAPAPVPMVNESYGKQAPYNPGYN